MITMILVITGLLVIGLVIFTRKPNKSNIQPMPTLLNILPKNDVSMPWELFKDVTESILEILNDCDLGRPDDCINKVLSLSYDLSSVKARNNAEKIYIDSAIRYINAIHDRSLNLWNSNRFSIYDKYNYLKYLIIMLTQLLLAYENESRVIFNLNSVLR